MEFELLYQQFLDMAKDGKISIHNDLPENLRIESNKTLANNNSQLLTSAQRKACSSLRNNKNIVIREADKSKIYVILDRTTYQHKLYEILNDS